MRRIILITCMVITGITAQAGGIMTNTNYHIAFDRMMARGATFDIDAIYSNPAGLAWGYDGWQLSLNFQKPWQYRDILLTTSDGSHLYRGKASAPMRYSAAWNMTSMTSLPSAQVLSIPTTDSATTTR